MVEKVQSLLVEMYRPYSVEYPMTITACYWDGRTGAGLSCNLAQAGIWP